MKDVFYFILDYQEDTGHCVSPVLKEKDDKPVYKILQRPAEESHMEEPLNPIQKLLSGTLGYGPITTTQPRPPHGRGPQLMGPFTTLTTTHNLVLSVSAKNSCHLMGPLPCRHARSSGQPPPQNTAGRIKSSSSLLRRF